MVKLSTKLSVQYFTEYTNNITLANRCVKNLARAGGVVEPGKILLSSSLITVQYLVAVWADVGDSKNLGVLEPHRIEMEIVPSA